MVLADSNSSSINGQNPPYLLAGSPQLKIQESLKVQVSAENLEQEPSPT